MKQWKRERGRERDANRDRMEQHRKGITLPSTAGEGKEESSKVRVLFQLVLSDNVSSMGCLQQSSSLQNRQRSGLYVQFFNRSFILAPQPYEYVQVSPPGYLPVCWQGSVTVSNEQILSFVESHLHPDRIPTDPKLKISMAAFISSFHLKLQNHRLITITSCHASGLPNMKECFYDCYNELWNLHLHIHMLNYRFKDQNKKESLCESPPEILAFFVQILGNL